MEIEVSDFKKALEIVKPGLAATTTTIEQVTSFAFTKKNVITYNDEICIYHPLGDLKLQGAIEAELLYKFLLKVKTAQISLEIDETKVTMKSGRSKAEFNIDPEIKLPLDDEKLTEKGKWYELPKNFIEAVTMAKACTSKDMIRVKLTCVHVNKKGIIESSDGYRIFRYRLGEKLPINSVLIPANSINSVIRIKPNKVADGNGWIHFKNDAGTVISCRVLNEEYMNVSEHLKDGKNGVELEFPKELVTTLDTAEIFAENFMVKITITKKKLIVTSQSQLANFKEELDLVNKVEPFAFQITPYLLKDILKQVSACTIYNDRLIFKNDNWKYMTELSIVED
jgi:hypothetical protein